MKLCESLLRVSTDGVPEQIPVTPGSVTRALLADLLHTDVADAGASGCGGYRALLLH